MKDKTINVINYLHLSILLMLADKMVKVRQSVIGTTSWLTGDKSSGSQCIVQRFADWGFCKFFVEEGSEERITSTYRISHRNRVGLAGIGALAIVIAGAVASFCDNNIFELKFLLQVADGLLFITAAITEPFAENRKFIIVQL